MGDFYKPLAHCKPVKNGVLEMFAVIKAHCDTFPGIFIIPFRAALWVRVAKMRGTTIKAALY